MSDSDDLILAAIAGKRPSATGWARGNCPWCEIKTGKPDKKQCLGVLVTVGHWHCFRCGSSGYLHAGNGELEDLARDVIISEADRESIRAAMEPPDGFTLLFDGIEFSFAGDLMRDYLTGTGRTLDGDRKRELSESVCKSAGIGAIFSGCGSRCEPRCIRCRIRGRVVVPIFADDGVTWLGWSARALFKTSRKYLYPPGMQRADLLYNHRALHVETWRPVFVVEGVFDAIALYPDAVAVLGKTSLQQEDALLLAKRPIVVCMDGDAWREGRALSLRLRQKKKHAGFVRLEAGEDPDEVPRDVLDHYAAKSLEA